MVRMPAWSAAYALFRLGDGLAAAVVSLAVVFHYGLPLWTLAATVATMNLAAVPASVGWGRLMERGRGRRRLAVGGFAMAGVGMAWLAALPPFPQFVAGAVLFTIGGTATGPAAAVLVIEGRPRKEWAALTGRLGAVTGWPHVAGLAAAVVLGLGGGLDYSAVFMAAAVFCVGAGATAAWAIPPWPGHIVEAGSRRTPGEGPPSAVAAEPGPPDEGVVPRLAYVEASQPRMERTVFRPGRLRFRPDMQAMGAGLARPYRLWTLGIVAVFASTLLVYAVLPGVLARHMGLSAGLILLAQAPGHIAAPSTFGWAGRLGSRIGEGRTAVRAGWARILAMAMLVAAVLAAAPWSLAAVLVAQAGMGVSFALLQVNGGCLMAQIHPDGRGAGVGAFHAAVGTGVVLGSVSAWALLAVVGFQVVYGVALVGCLAGAWMMRRAWWRTFPADRGQD